MKTESVAFSDINITNIIVVVSLICIVISAIVVLINRCKTRKQILNMERMIDAATKGSFQETVFDESLMSQLENKLAHYLRSNEVSSKNLAVEKDKIKTLIADISHQTKTPIANLILYSELLQEQEIPTEALNYANQLHTQAEKLEFLIASLVKLSRLETGIMTYQPQKNEVAYLLEDIKKTFMTRASEKGLRLIVEDSDVIALYDRKWTSEAISNIVDNAIKYTSNGEIRISVKSYEMFIAICIYDTGQGIDESEQARIFGRFYRGEQVHEDEGVGIGLFLAREIISGQGGYIKVESEVGKGSNFSVYLPK